ncbi:hypothetical protein NFI96_002248 [Prochilodus magdalenae]|nr:hypothetical protein NFI96_002248 [Prochilodus magdalenae]
MRRGLCLYCGNPGHIPEKTAACVPKGIHCHSPTGRIAPLLRAPLPVPPLWEIDDEDRSAQHGRTCPGDVSPTIDCMYTCASSRPTRHVGSYVSHLRPSRRDPNLPTPLREILVGEYEQRRTSFCFIVLYVLPV